MVGKDTMLAGPFTNKDMAKAARNSFIMEGTPCRVCNWKE
jgi:hypothetical protein